MTFDKRQTNIAKGIAILLLLWRHLFQSGVEVDSLLCVFGMPIEIYLDSFSFVCVSVFLFLSGYGLQKSFSSYYSKNENKKKITIYFSFVKRHVIKLTLEYLFIFIICSFTNWIFFGDIIEKIYQGNIFYLIINAFGFSNIFSTPSMYGTWWFNGLILGLYLLFPLFWKLNEYCGEFLLFISITLVAMPGEWDFDSLRKWGLPFILGMYFAKKDLFLKIFNYLGCFSKQLIVSISGLIALATIRTFILYDSEKLDAFFALSVVLTCYLVVSKIPMLNKVLYELGRKSSIMYLIHPLVFSMFLSIIDVNVSVLVYLILTVICFVVAWVVLFIQHIIRYDKLTQILCGK